METNEIPAVLYKFMPASYDGGKTLLPVLRGGHIRFTQPDGMNDPYELLGGFRDETDYRTQFAKVYRKEILTDARNARIRGHRQRIPLPKLVKALNAIQHSHDFENGSIAQSAHERFHKLLQNYGILSLADNCQSSAMWSHYAEVHSGVCVGFNPAMPLFHRGKSAGILSLRKVVYCEDRVPLAIGDSSVPVPNDLFFRKSSDWSYEKEWRVVARFSDLPSGSFRKNGLAKKIEVITLPIDLEYVSELIIGARADQATEKAALDFANKAKKQVQVFRMKLSQQLFRMEKIGPLQ